MASKRKRSEDLSKEQLRDDLHDATIQFGKELPRSHPHKSLALL